MATAGPGTAGPWPTRSRLGASARSARADSSYGGVAVSSRLHLRFPFAAMEAARDRHAAVAREDVAGDQRPVARVEERDVAGRVTRAGDGLEAADAHARLEAHVR